MASRPSEHVVSYIIPCYGCRRTIAFTLQSIQQQRWADASEVIVVDSSEEGIGDWLRTTYPRVEVVSSDQRLTAPQARNVGLAAARGDYLAFVDADVVLAPDWLETLVKDLTVEPDIEIAGAAIRNGNPSSWASWVQYWIEFSEFLPGGLRGRRSFLSSSNLLMARRTAEKTPFPEDLEMAEDLLYFAESSGVALLETQTSVRHSQRTRFGSVFGHLRQLGYWSGRFRRMVKVKGSRLAKMPVLSLMLPFWRLWAILARIRAAGGWKQTVLALTSIPLLLAGLLCWSWGFFQGIKRSAGSPTENTRFARRH